QFHLAPPRPHSYLPLPAASVVSSLSLHDALPILRSPDRYGPSSDPVSFCYHQRSVHSPPPLRGRTAGRRQSSGHPPGYFSFCQIDRKSTRLNSSHVSISYAVFCLKKKKHAEYKTH